jgi:uncharacterized protein YjbI with pentapeptide repeats
VSPIGGKLDSFFRVAVLWRAKNVIDEVREMDRDETMKLLKGGPAGIHEWNRRRIAGKDIPDLGGADLRGAHLIGANLSRANLIEADLRGAVLNAAILIGADLSTANFSGANLLGADLLRAHLIGANLSGAKLRRAKLTEADLSGANLSGANLLGADFSGANLIEANLNKAELFRAHLNGAQLSNANLSRAICSHTGFVDLDLSRVIGVESVEHWGPSSVGIDTLFLSNGKIPEVFLRGCGVPEALIGYLPYVFRAIQPIQFYSCFISYNHNDEEFAKRLHSRMLQEKLRVWYAPEDIKGGQRIFDQVDRAIHVQDKLLLVLSDASMRSAWVETELRSALGREQKESRQILFPIRITSWEAAAAWKCFDSDTGRDLARLVREYHIPDFSNWKDHDAFETAFARLLDDLKANESQR